MIPLAAAARPYCPAVAVTVTNSTTNIDAPIELVSDWLEHVCGAEPQPRKVLSVHTVAATQAPAAISDAC